MYFCLFFINDLILFNNNRNATTLINEKKLAASNHFTYERSIKVLINFGNLKI